MAKRPDPEAIYNSLKDSIVSMKRSPGELLSVSELEREYGAGRPVISEVMARLESDMLVQKSKGRYSVSPISMGDIHELSELREALECKSCELIISRGGLTAAEEKEIRGINRLMEEAVKDFRYKDALLIDDAFHAEIVRLSGNRNLEIFTEKVRMLISRIRWLSLLTSNLSVTADEHDHIIDCLVNKDRDAAVSSMREHIHLAEESFSRIYENNSDYEKSYQVLKTLTNSK